MISIESIYCDIEKTEKVFGSFRAHGRIASIASVSTLWHFFQKPYLLFQKGASISSVVTFSIFPKNRNTCCLPFWDIPRPFAFIICIWTSNLLFCYKKIKSSLAAVPVAIIVAPSFSNGYSSLQQNTDLQQPHNEKWLF